MNAQELAVMEKIHAGQLSILSEFDRVCRNHNIPYYLAAGTLLGAVRHKDFIPWDDDMDVYLRREDYNRFLQYIDEFEEPFEIHMPSGTDSFFWDCTTRLVNTNCRLKHDKVENEYYRHRNNEFLFLDIFVLDKTYSGIRYKLQILQLKILYGLSMSRRMVMRYDDYPSIVGKMEAFFLSKAGALFRMERIYDWYYKVQTKYNRKSDTTHEFPSNITVKLLGKLYYKIDWHDKTTELTIRGKKVLAPSAYDEILKSAFGDYMTPPPEDKRIPEHIKGLLQVEFVEQMDKQKEGES